MKKIFYLLFILMCKLSFVAASSEDQHLFQLGFEFQECHHMCPWAIEEPEIQSTPIFSVIFGERILWDITIDWQDLEFVTKPVANNEMDILEITMKSIQIACDVLVDLNEKASSSVDVTFSKWKKSFQKALQEKTDKNISSLIISTHSFNTVAFGSFKFPVSRGLRFDFEFQPQVTIQHHLINSINLCLGLFVEGIKHDQNRGYIDTQTSNAKYLNPFIESASALFTREGQTTTYFFSNQSSAQNGFTFLHMLTCIDLSHERADRLVVNCDLNFKESTPQTKKMCLLHYDTGQVNAKSSVNFMSRRPFSLMWEKINQGICYEDVLKGSVSELFLDSLKSKFDQINYGEIFFTDDGKRMDLTQCLFSSSPVLKDPNIQFLLQNGILSTDLIRMIEPDYLQNYFVEMIKSINTQINSKRCVFDKKEKKLKTQQVKYDLLSPPHLSSEVDSMGAYNDSNKHVDEFGEAIIEFRMIDNIPESVLRKISEYVSCEFEQDMKGNFLTKDFSLDTKNKKKREFKNDCFDLQTQTKGLFLYVTRLIKGELK